MVRPHQTTVTNQGRAIGFSGVRGSNGGVEFEKRVLEDWEYPLAKQGMPRLNADIDSVAYSIFHSVHQRGNMGDLPPIKLVDGMPLAIPLAFVGGIMQESRFGRNSGAVPVPIRPSVVSKRNVDKGRLKRRIIQVIQDEIGEENLDPSTGTSIGMWVDILVNSVESGFNAKRYKENPNELWADLTVAFLDMLTKAK
jgi:hypothetical protein